MLEQPPISPDHSPEEEAKERMKRLQEKVWDNLYSSGLLEKILYKSGHADEGVYDRAEFWSEIGAGKDHQTKMWLQILIKHVEGKQPVTPKLNRITEDPEEQKKLSGQIWEGITEDDLRFIAKYKADDYHLRDQKNWLSPEQSQAIKALYPAIENGRVKIELIPDYAQYSIVPEK